MKSFAQLFFICLLMVSSYIFFDKYFLSEKIKKNSKIVSKNVPSTDINKNNIIRNLKYEISLLKGNKYIITSETSEIEEIDDYELVNMKTVKATLIDKNRSSLVIKSLNASFNNSNYNTTFSKDVSIEYMDNKIFSNTLHLDFKKNLIEISDNVIVESQYGTIRSDKIVIDLITKKIDISMSSVNKDIELIKY